MASLQHPFQRLQYASRQAQGSSDVLIGTAGRYIYSYNATDGQRMDVWPQDVESTTEPASGASATTEDQTPPEKKRKISTEPEPQERKPSSAKRAPAWTTVPLVTVSSDGKYIIAVTGEDKAVRVFELSDDGKLKELSSRQTILTADKFGDAFSMPLIPGDYVKKAVETKPAGPSATPLTVHTKGNLRTLEMQKQMAEINAAKAAAGQGNDARNFEHHNILGHVSVLTDVINVSLAGKEYILTADRDEHIRVSRGIPQVHVIEQFCMGHTSLVSKLCVPENLPHLLISGDLDGNLFVWNWKQGQILQHISLHEALQSEVMPRGIWNISIGQVNVILISLEGYVSLSGMSIILSNKHHRSSQLLCYTIEENTLRAQTTVQLSGNVLDIIAIKSNSFIASVDTVRQANSTDSWNSNSGALLEYFQINIGPDGIHCTPAEHPMVANINLEGTSGIPAGLNEKQQQDMNNLLYNFENLKKKSYDE
ncbi:hypothetical protein N7478_004116 [Penicillium angulare]|uniref:uncharacterized protein n=1 Tax=Penicillium angulare TaxID=116970 RepID=UPI002541473A|nr:uncharacterized protein N7478_004116 [Penicillium angulare]KAJ5278744.1 hypothetical protein N7478_004116 [Penicillium angulare]